MEKLSNLYGNLVKHVSLVIFGIVVLFLTGVSILFSCRVNSDEYTYYERDHGIINVICLFVWCIFVYAIKKYGNIRVSAKTKKILWIVSLCIYTIAIAAFVFYLRLPPKADQKRVLEIAMNMIGGEYSEFKKGGYVDTYPNQVGLIYFCYVLFQVFPFGYYALRLLNVFSISLSVLLINEIGNLLFEQKGEKKYIYGIVTMLFLPLAGYVTFLYGNNIGLALSLAGIWAVCKFLKKQRWRYVVLAIVALAFSVIVKENYLISVIGVLVVLLYYFFKNPNRKIVVCLAGITIGTLLFSHMANWRVEKIIGMEISDGVPALAWVAMGLQEGYMADGWHNGYNHSIYWDNDCNTEKTEQVVKEDLKERVQEMIHAPAASARFFYHKTVSQWNNPTFECFWINDLNRRKKEGVAVGSYNKMVESVLGEPGNPILYEYMNIYQSVVWLGILFWLFFKGREASLLQILFVIIFVGGFLFHTIWEAKCQYVMPYFILILPYAVMGYREMAARIGKK